MTIVLILIAAVAAVVLSGLFIHIVDRWCDPN